jgi:hypothetical protein
MARIVPNHSAVRKRNPFDLKSRPSISLCQRSVESNRGRIPSREVLGNNLPPRCPSRSRKRYSPLCRNYSRSLPQACHRSLPRCFGSILCSIRSEMIRASKNSAKISGITSTTDRTDNTDGWMRPELGLNESRSRHTGSGVRLSH